MKDNDAMRSLEWVDHKLDMHKSYVDTFCLHEDSWTARVVRHKQREIAALETIRTALLKSAQVDGLVKLIKIMIDNDPNETISDADHTVYQHWKNDAERQLKQFSATEI